MVTYKTRPIDTWFRKGFYYINGGPLKMQIPRLESVDFSQVDVILISNYMNMLALPYVTEHTEFKGVIYATEPTKQIGK